jgi:hypothetical protein
MEVFGMPIDWNSKPERWGAIRDVAFTVVKPGPPIRAILLGPIVAVKTHWLPLNELNPGRTGRGGLQRPCLGGECPYCRQRFSKRRRVYVPAQIQERLGNDLVWPRRVVEIGESGEADLGDRAAYGLGVTIRRASSNPKSRIIIEESQIPNPPPELLQPIDVRLALYRVWQLDPGDMATDHDDIRPSIPFRRAEGG